ncbi:hypothetical protein QBC46DRAFT_381119 [Diplogelasinospora grovesii]|uniref:Translation initiation factor IF-2, mitochondrial n=1 Tax=Diplogelasinospora grovesii TaxID=303347 RepID=A0AAN6NA98_9PEZI|nr:hypothetical protein QBC46DRAFT_381119 [Diplogelasinospora grovesii]
MMRGGLWQKRSSCSVCALCRHSSGSIFRPNRIRYYSSESPGSPSFPSPTSSSDNNGQKSAWGVSNWGSTTSFVSSGPGSAGSAGGTTRGDDGLLPHERAARDAMRRSMAQQSPSTTGNGQPTPNTNQSGPQLGQGPTGGHEARLQHRPQRKPAMPSILAGTESAEKPRPTVTPRIRPLPERIGPRPFAPRPDRQPKSVPVPHHGPSIPRTIPSLRSEGGDRTDSQTENPAHPSSVVPRNFTPRPRESMPPRARDIGGMKWAPPPPRPGGPSDATPRDVGGMQWTPPPRPDSNLEWSQLSRKQQPPRSYYTPGPLADLGRDMEKKPANSEEFWAQARDRFPSDNTKSRIPTAPRRAEPRGNSSASPFEELTRNAVDPRANIQKQSDTDTWDWIDEHVEESKQSKAAQQSAAADSSGQPQPANPNPAIGLDNEGMLPSRRKKLNAQRPEEPFKKVRNRRSGPRDYNGPEDDYDEDSVAERRRRKAVKKAEKERRKQQALAEAGPIPILLPEFISVSNLALALGVKPDIFLGQLEELGFENVTRDSIMAGETAALVAQEYGFEPTVDAGEDEDLKPSPPPADPSALPPRPPVVTIMGHVDHGKTTLLDYLRKSSIVAGEHGGITQHIGAFSVRLSSGKQITFLDTPGHAAFLTMRQRGANVTDIVILVVAADDSVKPQTIEALKHARAAKVPIIVAINKVDKDEANVDRVKSDLAAQGVEIEDYGGDVQVVCVSGKTGQGMSDLEENIILLSEILDLRAEREGIMAEGWVLESSIKPIGRVATVLVKRGTLKQGDYVVAGRAWAKIRSLRNEFGVEVTSAPPGTPVEILGWKEPPDAGDQILQAPDEGKAKNAAHYREELKGREEAMARITQQETDRREALATTNTTADEDGQGVEGAAQGMEGAEKEGGPIVVNFLVKGDVHGSVEAVCAAVMEIGSNEIRPRVLRSATGQITESDVEQAGVTGSHIINFNNPIPGNIKRMADTAGVKVLDHNIIYHLAEDVRDSLSSMLAPTITTKVVGEAEILQVFPINVKGRQFRNVAGCRVRNGQVTRNSKCRVIRNGDVVFEGTIESLKHGKKDVAEMRKGAECGISFKDFDDFKQGDNVQVFEEIREKRKL